MKNGWNWMLVGEVAAGILLACVVVGLFAKAAR